MADLRPVHRVVANYRKPEIFSDAVCAECPRGDRPTFSTEKAMLAHARKTGHRIVAEYVKTYSVRAQ